MNAAVKLLMALAECPHCGERNTIVTHASVGIRTCNGCSDEFCTNCFYGARYCCSYVYPPRPKPSLERQVAVGVQSPKAEEKGENK